LKRVKLLHKIINMNQQELSLETIDSVIALYSNGKIEEAIDAIKLLNENYPNSPILFNILGACYKTLGRTQKAIENYELAIVIKTRLC
jgi:tetratricopeptide (TPR) repeat protein